MKSRTVSAIGICIASLILAFVFSFTGFGCNQIDKQLDATAPQYAATPGHPATATQPAAATQPADRVAQGAVMAEKVATNPVIQVVANEIPWGAIVVNSIGTIGAVVLAIDQAIKGNAHASRANAAEAALAAATTAAPSILSAAKTPTAASINAAISAVGTAAKSV